MPKIYIENLEMTIEVNSGLNLLNNFIIHHVPIHTVCGGRAMCGCCRIRILSGSGGISKVKEEERSRLGDDLIAQGWRLSCQTHCVRDIRVYVPGAGELDGICAGKTG